MGKVSFGGGHRDLRAGPGIEDFVGLPGNGAAYHVGNGQDLVASAPGQPEGSKCIRRFTGLADDDNHGLFVQQGIAITKFRGQIHLYRDAQYFFHGILADQAGMVGRAAGDDIDFGDVIYFFRGKVQLGEVELPAAV